MQVVLCYLGCNRVHYKLRESLRACAGPRAARTRSAAGTGAGRRTVGQENGIEPPTPALGRLAAQNEILLRASAVRQNVGSLARFHVSVGFRTIQDLSGENSGWVTKFVIDSKKLWLPVWKTLKIFSPKVSSHRNTGLTGIDSSPHALGPPVCRCVSGRELQLAGVRRRAQEVRK